VYSCYRYDSVCRDGLFVRESERSHVLSWPNKHACVAPRASWRVSALSILSFQIFYGGICLYLAQLSVKLVICRLSFFCYHCLEYVRWYTSNLQTLVLPFTSICRNCCFNSVFVILTKVFCFWYRPTTMQRSCEIILRSVVVLQCILLVCDVEKSAVDNILWQIIADRDTRICWKWYEVMLLYNIRVFLKTISRDTEHVTNFHKQCQNFAEKCHTTSHRTLTD